MQRLMRRAVTSTAAPSRQGIVLGSYKLAGKGPVTHESILGALTPTSASLVAQLNGESKQRLLDSLTSSGFHGKPSQNVTLYSVDSSSTLPPVVTFVGLGEKDAHDVDKSRQAAAVGARALRDIGVMSAVIEPMDSEHAVAEGVTLGQYAFDEYLSKAKGTATFELFNPLALKSGNPGLSWATGKIYAESQNTARRLMNLPANHLTPTKFAEYASSLVGSLSGVDAKVRNEAWIEEKGMRSFLAVSKGSVLEPVMLDFNYTGNTSSTEHTDLALVGKGITFDSGGISIKPSGGMGMMKGDMGGAAVCLATFVAAATMKLPVNLRLVIPLCENMPSGHSMRPGDIVRAMNGKSIEIDNTDAEGRLILADALTYVTKQFKPARVVDVATLTGAMDVALGSAMAGVFSNKAELFEGLQSAGEAMGDPLWRMPLHESYGRQIKGDFVDVRNVGGKGAGACTAAMFLKEFLDDEKKVSWAHIDIAGVMHSDSTRGHLVKGMSGRPTRSLIEFIRTLNK